MRSSFPALLAMLGATTLAACGLDSSREDARSTPNGDPRPLVVRELQEQVSAAEPSSKFSPADVLISSEESQAVPDVRYYFGVVASSRYSHREYRAVVGERAGRARAIMSINDWNELTENWRPTNGRALLQACAEVYRALRALDRRNAVVFTGGALSHPAIFVDEIKEIQRRAAPPRTAESTRGTSEALFWIVQGRSPRGAVKIRCGGTPSSVGGLGSISVMDSITFPEMQ